MKESENRPNDFLLLFTPSWKEVLKASLLLLLALVVVRYRAFYHIGTHFLGGFERDAGLYVWLSKTYVHNLFSIPWFNTKAFYPYGMTLAWSDNFILPSFSSALLRWFGFSELVSYNLTILLSSLLNGLVTFALCYQLIGKFWPALIGGIAFMASAFLGGHLGHPQLQFAFWLPLGMFLFFRFVERSCWRRAFWVGLSLLGAILSAVYYSIFLLFMVFVLAVGLLLLKPKAFSLKDCFQFLIGLGLSGLLSLPFLLPYSAVKSVFGERQIYEPFAFSANASSLFSSSSFNWLYSFSSSWSHPESQYFCGFLMLIAFFLGYKRISETRHLRKYVIVFSVFFCFGLLLSLSRNAAAFYLCSLSLWFALVALGLHLRQLGGLEEKLNCRIVSNRSLQALLFFLGVVTLVVSFGPLGSPEIDVWATGPYRVFFEFFPGFSGLRAIGRIGVVYVLCCSVLLAFLAQKLLSGFPKYAKLIVVVLPVFLFLENRLAIYPLDLKVDGGSVFEFLEAMPTQNDALMVLPFSGELKPNETVASWSEFAHLNVNYMNWAAETGLSLVNGYSGIRSKAIREYPRKMSGFPDLRSLNTLSTIVGLKYVVVMSRFIEGFDTDKFEKQIKEYDLQLSLVHKDSFGNYLFEFKPDLELYDGFYLALPPRQAGVLGVRVSYETNKASEDSGLEIYINYGEGEKPLTNLSFAGLPNPAWLSIPVPKTAEKIRPLKVIFNQRNLKVLKILGTSFSPGT